MRHLPPTPPAVERASEHDRLWFEKHPGVRERTRALIPGEFPGIKDDSGLVEVICTRPGLRARRCAGRDVYAFALDVDPGTGVMVDDLLRRSS